MNAEDPARRAVTPEIVAAHARDGAVCLRRLLSPAEVHRLRVFTLRVQGDDMMHAPRSWVTSPPFPGLADRLPAGAAMDDLLFPVLWERHS